MRDILRQRPRQALLATGLGVSLLAFAQQYFDLANVGDWLFSRWGIWWGIIGAVLGTAWLAAVVGAYRLVEGHELVGGWLEVERRESLASGLKGAVASGLMLITLEELVLRGALLHVAGPLAVVLAAGLWRLHGGRRATLWGMLHGLLLTGIALISGNVMASWVAHVITEGFWLSYLLYAPWRQELAQRSAQGTGVLG